MTQPHHNQQQQANDPPPHPTALVLLLCGLPASGKSTLARSILHHYHNHPSSSFFDRVVHIEYDGIEQDLMIITTQNKKDEGNIAHDSNGDDNGKKVDDDWREYWKQARSESLNLLEVELDRHFSVSENEGECKESKTRRRLLIIMDDNFHLKSMRRDVYRICQQKVDISPPPNHTFVDDDDINNNNIDTDSLMKCNKISMAVIFVQVPMEECLERNRLRHDTYNDDDVPQRLRRGRRVPDHVIRNMSQKLEPPVVHNDNNVNKEVIQSSLKQHPTTTTIKKNCSTSPLHVEKGPSHDRFSLIIDLSSSSSNKNNNLIVNTIHPFLQQISSSSSSNIQSIRYMNYLQQMEQNRLQNERLLTYQSIQHQCDRLLRKLVQACVVGCDDDKKKKKMLGKIGNDGRKIVLEEVRNGDIVLLRKDGGDDGWEAMVTKRFVEVVLSVAFGKEDDDDDGGVIVGLSCSKLKNSIQEGYDRFCADC